MIKNFKYLSQSIFAPTTASKWSKTAKLLVKIDGKILCLFKFTTKYIRKKKSIYTKTLIYLNVSGGISVIKRLFGLQRCQP